MRVSDTNKKKKASIHLGWMNSEDVAVLSLLIIHAEINVMTSDIQKRGNQFSFRNIYSVKGTATNYLLC